MKVNKMLLAGIIGATVASLTTAVLTHRPKPTTEVNVTKTVLTVAAGTNATLNASKHVVRLEPDPQQILLLNTEVDQISVDILIDQIEKAAKSYDEIYLVMDSPGGSVFDGVRLISYMEASTAHINTVNVGLCASMCAEIFAHGHKRYALDRSTLMYHSAAGGMQGTVPQMKALLDYIDLETQRLDAYVADRAGIKREDFALMSLKNLWISGEDAVSMHLAEHLATIPVMREAGVVFNMKVELEKRKVKTRPKFYRNPLQDIY